MASLQTGDFITVAAFSGSTGKTGKTAILAREVFAEREMERIWRGC